MSVNPAIITSAVKQAFDITKPLQASVTFTHKAQGTTFDPHTGTRSSSATAQTLDALVDEIKVESIDGRDVKSTALYVDESVLTITIEPEDTAVFNGETWIVEPPIMSTSPGFVRAIHVRTP